MNSDTLSLNDETYALIDKHVARISSREKPSPLKDMQRKVTKTQKIINN